MIDLIRTQTGIWPKCNCPYKEIDIPVGKVAPFLFNYVEMGRSLRHPQFGWYSCIVEAIKGTERTQGNSLVRKTLVTLLIQPKNDNCFHLNVVTTFVVCGVWALVQYLGSAFCWHQLLWESCEMLGELLVRFWVFLCLGLPIGIYACIVIYLFISVAYWVIGILF